MVQRLVQHMQASAIHQAQLHSERLWILLQAGLQVEVNEHTLQYHLDIHCSMQTFFSIYASMIFLVAPSGLSINGATCEDWLHGYYDNWNVYLCPVAMEDEWVRLHETGHHIWFVYLTEEQQQEWSKLPWSVTEYAKESVKEDFAETFASYMLERKPWLWQKYRFLRKLKLK